MNKEFNGWNCEVIRSGELEALVTLDVGPRVISLSFNGSSNLFFEIEADKGKSGEEVYRHYGGHRLWTTPESTAYSYNIENSPVVKDGEWFLHPIDPRGLQKAFKIEAVPQGFLVSHRLTNLSSISVESSPWGITMLNPGGTAFFPNEPKISHGPGSLLPVRSLSLWSYTNMADSRLAFTNEITSVKQKSTQGSFKIGAYVSLGWGAYINGNHIFHKTFEGKAASYPDLGANFEVYTDDNLLETETTGIFGPIPPGESVVSREVWQVFDASEDFVQESNRKALEVKSLIS